MNKIVRIPIHAAEVDQDFAGRAIYGLENAVDDLREACERDVYRVREDWLRIHKAYVQLQKTFALIFPIDAP